MFGTNMPDSLRVVFEHLKAVRELNRYLRTDEHHVAPGVGVLMDLQRYVEYGVRPALEDLVPVLKTWSGELDGDRIKWAPESWKLSQGLCLALVALLPAPLDSEASDPSVNLSAPQSFLTCTLGDCRDCWVKTLLDQGFTCPGEVGRDQEYPIGKCVPWLDPDGSFNERGLLRRIARETTKIVELEPLITQALRAYLSKSSIGPSFRAPWYIV